MSNATVEARTHSDLFQPVWLGPYRLANRIAMAPLTRSRAGADGVPHPLMAELLRAAQLGRLDHRGRNQHIAPGKRLCLHPRCLHCGAGRGVAARDAGSSRQRRPDVRAALACRPGVSSLAAARRCAARGTVGDPPRGNVLYRDRLPTLRRAARALRPRKSPYHPAIPPRGAKRACGRLRRRRNSCGQWLTH
jgi:hypothetical protein